MKILPRRYFTQIFKNVFQESGLPTWKAFTIAEENYLDIKSEPEQRKGVKPERNFLWQKLFWDDFEEDIHATSAAAPRGGFIAETPLSPTHPLHPAVRHLEQLSPAGFEHAPFTVIGR